MSSTPRHNLPYIVQSQSQKEVTHNEGLNRLDAIVQPLIEDKDLTAPPGAPAEGAIWIVAAGAAGDWAGQDNALAQYIGGAWTFHVPTTGFRAWLDDEGQEVRWTGSAWVVGQISASSLAINGTQVLTAQQPAIVDAGGGTTIDSEARTALNELLAACRAHGIIAS